MVKSSNKNYTIAVTGATGFVGKHLINQILEKGFNVRALIRSSQKKRAGVTWIKGDLNNEKALKKLVSDADLVIHMAGLIKALSKKDFFEINAKGTENILSAVNKIAEKSRPFFLHISSLAAREPSLSHYAASKAASEEVVKNSENDKWAIIRPPAVYGPGDQETLKMFTPMTKGYAFAASSADNRFSMIHVEDLCKAFFVVAKTKACHKKTFELDDGLPMGTTISKIANMVSIMENRPIKMVTLPPIIVRFAGIMGTVWGFLTRKPQMLTHLKAKELLHNDWVVEPKSQASFSKQTGWKPTIDLDSGIKSTLEDYRLNGML